MDKDSPVDMKWIYDRALERAERFGIQGVTYQLTMGVVKNIIPAIASTNALVSAACVGEALKALTLCNTTLDNYMMYMGQTGVYVNTFVYGREKHCFICSRKNAIEVETTMSTKLRDFISHLKEKFHLKEPSITASKGYVYTSRPAALEEVHRFKLDLTFK